jgi:ankyrin repeat protein
MSAACIAAAVGDYLSLEASLATGLRGVEIDEHSGWTPLHFAVEGGHYECIALLAETVPSFITRQDTSGFSPIDLCCALDDTVALSILLEYVNPTTVAVDVSRGEAILLRVHRDTVAFGILQDWMQRHGLPVSPLVSNDGILRDRKGKPQDLGTESVVPVANHVTMPGETVKDVCFGYATTPRELRFINPDRHNS